MKVVVIGANAAGMSFAAKYKRNNPNHDVIVLEKRDYISFGSCGLPYFVGGMFDDEKVMISRTPEQIKQQGIDLRVLCNVINVEFDMKTIVYEQDGDFIECGYDKLVVATGATPYVPDFGDYNSANVHTLTNLHDGIKVKELFENKDNKNVVIIGGGFIGMEVLDVAVHLGKNVTLIEMNNHVLNHQFSKDITEVIEAEVRAKGVNLLCNTKVDKIVDVKKNLAVVCDDVSIKADVVVMALGFRPNTDFLDLEKLPNGAILTDPNGQTSERDVFAIGDCATVHHIVKNDQVYLPLATTANKYARSLADTMSGLRSPFKGMLGSSCLKVLDYEIACTGISERDARSLKIPYKVQVITDKNQTNYYPGQEDIMAKIIYDENSKIILGCEMVGKKGVVGRVDAMAVAIYSRLTTTELGYLDFCYSPPFSRSWDMLNVMGNVSK